MANARANRSSPSDDEIQPVARESPGTRLLADQIAGLILRILPHLGSITVAGTIYEYHAGFCTRLDDEPELRVPAQALIRIEQDHLPRAADVEVPVWTWRDKRSLIAARIPGTEEYAEVVDIPYVDAADITHDVTFRVDAAARAALLAESAGIQSAIAQRTVALLQSMLAALDDSPLASLAALRSVAFLDLDGRDIRSQSVVDRLARIDPDVPLDGREPRRLTIGIEQLQSMLSFTEGVVMRETAIVAPAVRALFTRVQGRRPVGWEHWLPGTAAAVYANGDEETCAAEIPVLVYHDEARQFFHVVEPAPARMPDIGHLVRGWPVRPFDAAGLLTDAHAITAALGAEWDERHRPIVDRVGAVAGRWVRRLR
jgi:hypothetical protein